MFLLLDGDVVMIDVALTKAMYSDGIDDDVFAVSFPLPILPQMYSAIVEEKASECPASLPL